MVSFLSVILLGFFLGMRHATDADHVVAVSTIISREKSIVRAAAAGAIWGVGHTITIFLVGAAIILFGFIIPPRLSLSMEFSVGLILVLLGLWNVRSFFRPFRESPYSSTAESATQHSHAHGHGNFVHSHNDLASADSGPHGTGEVPLASLDRLIGWLTPYQILRPFLVGIVHGLAGSAAVTLLILATIRDPRWAIAYLLVFGVGTIAGMMLVTMSIASAVQFAGSMQKRFSHVLGLTAGLISLVFGIYLTYQFGFSAGLFSAHPNWRPH